MNDDVLAAGRLSTSDLQNQAQQESTNADTLNIEEHQS